MRVATAAYPLKWLETWADYAANLQEWVAEAAGQGAELLVFPEYSAMELAGLAGAAAASDVRGSIDAVDARMPDAWDLHCDLASKYGVHVLAGSAPVRDGDLVVNRAMLCTPNGARAFQDKQIMTRFEREDWGVSGGGPLQVFDTALGSIAVLICYDSEFPLLGRAVSEAEVLLVPSCTEAQSGYWRVRIGAMSRALEGQCVSVMASLTGQEPRLFAVEENTGTGGVFGPPDRGFPGTGIMALGQIDVPGWTVADIDLAKIAEVRADGVVLNRTHWQEQLPRDQAVNKLRLR